MIEFQLILRQDGSHEDLGEGGPRKAPGARADPARVRKPSQVRRRPFDSATYLCLIERGVYKPRGHIITEFARVLGVNPDVFFYLADLGLAIGVNP